MKMIKSQLGDFIFTHEMIIFLISYLKELRDLWYGGLSFWDCLMKIISLLIVTVTILLFVLIQVFVHYVEIKYFKFWAHDQFLIVKWFYSNN